MDQREHVGGRLAQVFICGDLGERDLVGKPVDGERVADSECAWYVAFVAPIMLKRRAHMPSVDAVGCHVCPLIWSDVDEDSCAGRSEWALVEIVVAIQACAG